MALKDIWKNKVDGVDDVLADDINSIASAVIKNEKEIKNLKSNSGSNVNITIDTEMSDTSENPVQNKVVKGYVDGQIGDINTALENKTDKVTITTLSDTVLAVDFAEMYNSEIRTGELTSISFTFGNDAYEEDYTSGISFDSGETPTAIDYTDSGILNWVGTDCATSDELSIFQPSANTHYDIVFYFNGAQFIGLVNGFVPSTGNEAV